MDSVNLRPELVTRLTWHWGQAWCSSGRTQQSSGWGRLSPGWPLSLLALSSAVSRARRQKSQAGKDIQSFTLPKSWFMQDPSSHVAIKRDQTNLNKPLILCSMSNISPSYLYKAFQRNWAETRGRSVKMASPFLMLLLAKRPFPCDMQRHWNSALSSPHLSCRVPCTSYLNSGGGGSLILFFFHCDLIPFSRNTEVWHAEQKHWKV